MTRSPDQSCVRWLKAELPHLVQQDVLTAESAQALDQHFAVETQSEPSRIGFVISAILGSLLLGAGVILLVAHNWDQLKADANGFAEIDRLTQVRLEGDNIIEAKSNGKTVRLPFGKYWVTERDAPAAKTAYRS